MRDNRSDNALTYHANELRNQASNVKIGVGRSLDELVVSVGQEHQITERGDKAGQGNGIELGRATQVCAERENRDEKGQRVVEQ